MGKNKNSPAPKPPAPGDATGSMDGTLPNLTERMVRENIGWMLAVAHRFLNDRALAEDAVQEAFLAAFKGFENFENRSSLKTWLHRITVNVALQKLRQLKRRAEITIDDYLPDFYENDCRIERPWEHIASLDELLQTEENRLQIRTAINKLPDNYRAVILLRDIEGYTTAEVSELLDCSVSSAKVQLHRARAALKCLLEPLLRGEVFS